MTPAYGRNAARREAIKNAARYDRAALNVIGICGAARHMRRRAVYGGAARQ